MATRKLILIRGPSGSGKSTIARSLKENFSGRSSHHETDAFFSQSGTYIFDATKLKDAHTWNRCMVRRAIVEAAQPWEDNLIVVSNTFITHWEMGHYIEIANDFEYDLRMIRTPQPWDVNVLFKRNKHGVPLSTIERQISKYQPHEKDEEWNDLSIFS